MNSFRRYENGMIKEQDLLDRNIIRPWKKLLIKDFVSSEQSDQSLANTLKDIFADAQIKGWTADESSDKSSHLSQDNLLLITETIKEIRGKKTNIRTNLNSHILHYWRDEATPELKGKVYELFDLYEQAYSQ